MEQKTALEICKSGKNVFLTGPAGTGKTYLLDQYITWCKKKNRRVAVTASTGIAATHISGRTIHSWAGIGICEQLEQKDIAKILQKKPLRDRLRNTHVLIIDEVSMLHAYHIDLIDKVLRFARNSWEPFGGMQVIFAGDFFQLPPVNRHYDTDVQFAFESQTWQNASITVCYLTEQFRHKESDIISVLTAIRNQNITHEAKALLRQAHEQYFHDDDEITKLFTHNKKVDAINRQYLAHIDAPQMSFTMTSKGPEYLVQTLINGCLAPQNLLLKEGALVMFVRNNFEEGYINGTIGSVIDFDDFGYPLVQTRDGEEILVTKQKWVIEEDGKVIAQISQLPLRLAWAVTVHKSQGMTLDAAEIDLSEAFEYGMGYVALSRVRSLGDMRLCGINDIALQVNPIIFAKDREFQKLSRENEKSLC